MLNRGMWARQARRESMLRQGPLEELTDLKRDVIARERGDDLDSDRQAVAIPQPRDVNAGRAEQREETVEPRLSGAPEPVRGRPRCRVGDERVELAEYVPRLLAGSARNPPRLVVVLRRGRLGRV